MAHGSPWLKPLLISVFSSAFLKSNSFIQIATAPKSCTYRIVGSSAFRVKKMESLTLSQDHDLVGAQHRGIQVTYGLTYVMYQTCMQENALSNLDPDLGYLWSRDVLDDACTCQTRYAARSSVVSHFYETITLLTLLFSLLLSMIFSSIPTFSSLFA